MALKLYMDQHVPRSITLGLRLVGVDVLTAYEDGASMLSDYDMLDRAGKLNRVIFTRDDDLIAEAVRRQREGTPFSGVVFAHQLKASIGTCIRDLKIIAFAGEAEDLANQILFLPL